MKFSRPALALFAAATAHAADWSGGSGNWSSDGSPGWNGTGVPNAVGAVANFSDTVGGSPTQDIVGGVTVGTISYTTNAAASFVIYATRGITLNQDGAGPGHATISNSNTDTSNLNFVALFTGTATLADDLLVTNTGGGSTSNNGAIALFAGLAGTGNVTFRNVSSALTVHDSIRLSATNTFTGNVLIEKGTVVFGGAQAFGAPTNVVNLGKSGQGKANLVFTSNTGAGSLRNDIVVAAGAGDTLTLGSLSASNQTYSGVITLNGDVNLTSASTSGAGLTFSSFIIGDGKVTKTGAGTVTFTNTALHVGGTTISEGTLQIGDGGTTGSLAGDVALSAGGTLAFNRSDALTFGGAISGAGAVAKLGGGTTTLTGAATHTGGTTISAGTLQIGNGGTTGSLAGNVALSAGGTLAFNRSNDFTFGGAISGNGSVRQMGGGKTVLTGAATHTGGTTVSGGTLQIGNGGTTGSLAGNVALSAGTTLAFNRGDALTFEGEITGAGGVRHFGAGKTTFTGDSTYTGATTVEAGTLIVDGSITSHVTVKNGATFGGDGLIDGNITLESGSTLVTIDCLDADNLTWNPGATLVFSLGDGTNDILELSGSLLKGGAGSYSLSFIDADWQVGQTYPLITYSDTTLAGNELTFTNSGLAGYFTLDATTLSFTVTAVPEPTTSAAGVAGLLAVVILARRRAAARG